MEFIAHIRERDKAIQSVKEHLLEVKELAKQYGERIGVGRIAGLAGLLHDMGKYTDQFREYIWNAVHNPAAPSKRGSVDHSTAGGKLLYDRFHSGNRSKYDYILAEVVGNAIISHHSYLHDFLSPELESDYLRRVRDKSAEDIHYEGACRHFFEEVMSEGEFQGYVLEAAEELEAFLSKPSSESIESRLMFLAKFVFSALIDADRTNTRQFEEGGSVESERLVWNSEHRTELFANYYDKLMNKLNQYHTHPDAASPINKLRKEMSDQCEAFAYKPSGIYTLSIPTGGGKTLASFRYALRHAIEHGKRQIIYVVPYTTIIEQNAEEIRKMIQDDANLLEHHSNVVADEKEDDEQQDGRTSTGQKLKLAKDNWDSPIIFTTMVQFLNVFYARGTRNIRRLHNLSEAVIIFDEVQKVPTACVSIFNRALNFLNIHAGCSLILCTATQPALDFVEHKLQIRTDAEVISDLEQVADAFKRVVMVDRASSEQFDTIMLANFVRDKLEELQSVLVILNTKSVVRSLFEQLADSDVAVYHLSTAMCPAHRSDILERIKSHLNQKEKVVCISTQLIEAGVDISFDCVIRSLAGLDSIAQAAGRCNRHGEKGIQQVYVIDHEEENLKHLNEIKVGKEITKQLLIDLQRDSGLHGGHMLSLSAMEWYFQRFYKKFELRLNYYIPKFERDMTQLLIGSRKDHDSYFTSYTQTRKQPLQLFMTNSMRTAADHFEVIESYTTTVIAPYGEKGNELIARLNGDGTTDDLSRLLREAQQFSVNLFRYELDTLTQNGGLVPLLDGKVLALKEGAYSGQFGVDVGNESGFGNGIY